MDRLCHSGGRLIVQPIVTTKSRLVHPIVLRFFSRSQPAKGLADAQKSVQRSTDKFAKYEKAFRAIGFTAAVGYAAYLVLPHTALIGYVQPVFQQYTQGKPTRVSPKLKALISEVMEEVIEAGAEGGGEVRANAFIGNVPNPFLWGNPSSGKFVLMLPAATMFDTEKEFNFEQWQFSGSLQSSTAQPALLTKSQWETDAGKAFKQSALLTENAKKFLIARELERGKTGYFWVLGIVPLGNCFTGMLLYKKMVSSLGLTAAPKIVRSTTLIMTVLFWTGATVLLRDEFGKKAERESDAKACARGPDYARGGIEYYTKALSRGVALRTLMPNDKGVKLYNIKGERYPGFVRRKHVPLTERRNICQKALEQ